MSAKTNAILGWGAGGVMIAAIVGGLALIGSPGEARKKKEDGERLQSLQKTAKAISCYSDNIGELPEDIATIKAAYDDKGSDIRGSMRCRTIVWATDPVSGSEFEYNRIDTAVFELCAEFAIEGKGTEQYSRYGYYPNAYDVLTDTDKPRPAAGRHCYTAQKWDKDANF